MTDAEQQVVAIIAGSPNMLDYHDIEELCGTADAVQALYNAGVIFQPTGVCWDLASHRVWYEWLDMWRDVGSVVAFGDQ